MTTVTGLDDLKAHVGRRETADDVVTAAPANLLRLAFGREEPEFTWEATDKALALKQAA